LGETKITIDESKSLIITESVPDRDLVLIGFDILAVTIIGIESVISIISLIILSLSGSGGLGFHHIATCAVIIGFTVISLARNKDGENFIGIIAIIIRSLLKKQKRYLYQYSDLYKRFKRG